MSKNSSDLIDVQIHTKKKERSEIINLLSHFTCYKRIIREQIETAKRPSQFMIDRYAAAMDLCDSLVAKMAELTYEIKKLKIEKRRANIYKVAND